MHSTIRYAIVACLVAILGGFCDSVFAAQGKIELQWFGQSATKITTVSGKVIVIDPWLTKNPLTPQEYKNLDARARQEIQRAAVGTGRSRPVAADARHPAAESGAAHGEGRHDPAIPRREDHSGTCRAQFRAAVAQPRDRQGRDPGGR